MGKIYSPGIFALAICDGISGSFERSSFEDIPSTDSLLRMYEMYKKDQELQRDSPLIRRMEWLEQSRLEKRAQKSY